MKMAPVEKPAGRPGPSADRNHERYLVPGLQRGLQALEIVAAAGMPLSLAELARQMGLTRSSVFRLVYTLKSLEYLAVADSSREVSLAPRVLKLGFAFLASQDLVEVAKKELEALRDDTGAAAHLSVLDGRENLYLSCIQPRSGFLSGRAVGFRTPAHQYPAGWLLLGNLSRQELRDLYRNYDLEARTEHTPTTVTALETRIAAAIARGYVVSRGIVQRGGNSITAPVFDRSGRIVAAIDVSAPTSIKNLMQEQALRVSQVLAAARRISQHLGYWRETPGE
jgi:DNA-binding IclR family transcriptional regulator